MLRLCCGDVWTLLWQYLDAVVVLPCHTYITFLMLC
jgi:hypothetical protein